MSKSDNLKRHEVALVFKMHDQGRANRKIGAFLSRSHTAVGDVLRERQHYKRAKRWENLDIEERTRFVMEVRQKRQTKSRNRQMLKSPEIKAHVLDRLCSEEHCWTPEMIANTLENYFPGQSISAKAIYNFTKSRPEYKQYLREKGEPRRQEVSSRRSRFKQPKPEKRSIHERRALPGEIGHYEADTVLSRRGSKAAVLTIRERARRKTWYFPVANLEASTILPRLMLFFQHLPQEQRKSLTLDNGSEWSEAYYKLEKVLPNFQVYFCDSYKAYQRGAVENANKQLRVFYPKGTDFSQVSLEALKDTERIIDNWPMRVLGWKTPAQIWGASQEVRC